MEDPETPASDTGTTEPRRAVESEGCLTTTSTLFQNCNTVDDLFEQAAGRYSNARCLGTRRLVGVKKGKKLVLGKYKWENYEAVSRRIDNFGRGLLAYKLLPGSKLLIFAETCADWLIAAQACFRYNFQVMTVNATLDMQTVTDIILETRVSHIVTSDEQLTKFDFGFLDTSTSVTHLIVMTKPTYGNDELSNIPFDTKVIVRMNVVEDAGAKQENSGSQVAKPEKKDIAVIMYTKKNEVVEMSHENLLCGILRWCESIPQLGTKRGDLYIGYLPLSEVLELTAEIACLTHGIPIGYSSLDTLTDQAIRAVIEVKLENCVRGKVNTCAWLWRKIFERAYKYKLSQMKKGSATPLLDWLLFDCVRQTLGGRIRVMLPGGAPLSEKTRQLMAVCFNVPVLEGVDLTETREAGTMSRGKREGVQLPTK